MKFNLKFKILIIVGCLFFASFIFFELFKSNKIPNSTYFKVSSGENIYNISQNLYSQEYISSPFLFRIIMSFKGKDGDVSYGLYNFEANSSLYKIIKKLSGGKFDKPISSVTIPEGFDATQIAQRFSESLKIDRVKLERLAKENQGFLYPETYYFDEDVTEEEIIKVMREEFNTKYKAISKDKVILASVLQGEANNKKDMQIVSGILQERLRINMRLQVDVAMETYKKTGLPDEAINNPGSDAIYSVLNPIRTDYLYYITGNDGNMYYAKTFKEHRINIEKHLK